MDVFAAILFCAAVVLGIFNLTNGFLLLIAGVVAISAHLIRKELRYQNERREEIWSELAKDLGTIKREMKKK